MGRNFRNAQQSLWFQRLNWPSSKGRDTSITITLITFERRRRLFLSSFFRKVSVAKELVELFKSSLFHLIKICWIRFAYLTPSLCFSFKHSPSLNTKSKFKHKSDKLILNNPNRWRSLFNFIQEEVIYHRMVWSPGKTLLIISLHSLLGARSTYQPTPPEDRHRFQDHLISSHPPVSPSHLISSHPPVSPVSFLPSIVVLIRRKGLST